jgi:glycosyltransferase involved in cell wall biosynthesis
MRRVSVLGLVRDNEPWLKYATGALKALEDAYPATEFSYFFFENDSVDGTAEAVRAFLEGRKGALFQEGPLPPYENRGVNFDRVRRLADLRNRLLDRARPLLVDGGWTLLLDSDIVFDPQVLGRMFRTAQAAGDIVMVCPFAKEVRVSSSTGAVSDTGHYYDTYAFVDAQDRCHWPRCVFESCRVCPRGVTTIPASEDVVDVRSAFGGFALVETAALKDPRVRWRALDLPGGFAVCEHVAFCDALRASTGKRVVVAQSAQGVRWIQKVV